MSNDTTSIDAALQQEQQGDADQDLEFWKYFAGMGGTDKSTMIKTVSWLLAAGAALVSYIVTQLISPSQLTLQDPSKTLFVALLGLAISGLSGYLTLLYGGYANRNWAKADQIALKRGWLDLLPENLSRDRQLKETSSRRGLAALAWKLARPCDPVKALPPVFGIFVFLSGLSGLVHLAFFIWAIAGAKVS